jgi:DNA-binding CsgD family transcriptional regulator
MGRVATLQGEIAELARVHRCRLQFRSRVMDLVDREIGFVDCLLHHLDPGEPAERGIIRTGAPWSYIEDGLANWKQRYNVELNPLWHAAEGTRGVVIDTEVMGRDARSRLRFYNHVMAGVGAHHTMWSHLDVHGEIVATFAITRRGRGFTDGEYALVQELRPVLAVAEACYRSPSPALADEAIDRLTAREREIVALVVKGLTNPEIGTALSLSLHTVRNHLNTVFRKLDVGTRAELAGRAARGGTIVP